MKIVYSFNKKGYEAAYWTREIAACSDDRHTFIPFNHDPYLDPDRYLRAQLLDNLFYEKNLDLLRMYADVSALIAAERADALIVDNCFPYHPEFLRTLAVYKVLRTTDGPAAAYDRDFAYVHAYDHVLFHSPAYSEQLDMREKLAALGAKRADLWPLAVFDAAFDPSKTEDQLEERDRPIDVIFIGALHYDKMPILSQLKKAFGRRFVMHGLASWKRNLYYNATYGWPGWVSAAPFEQYVPLYSRARIGVNLHVRGDYTVGNYRLFELPANAVMQISDGGDHLNSFFEVGREIIRHSHADLIDTVKYYLAHDDERRAIARAGYRRVMRDHRLRTRMRQAADLLERAMASR